MSAPWSYLGATALIELASSTFVPAQAMPGSKDGRKLGVRIKRLILIGEPAGRNQ